MFGFGSIGYDPIAETPDLTGKVALVTGGNAGIGYEVVRHLARYGAKVYLAARNEERGRAALEKLQSNREITTGSIELLLMDVSLLKDVQRAAEEFLTKVSRLDILVCNAGTLLQLYPQYTEEGLSETFAANHFGNFLLIKTLTPLLKQTAAEEGSDVRIVILASQSHDDAPHVNKIDSMTDVDILKEPTYANAFKRYGLSKRFVVWYVQELQRRFDEEHVNIIVTCVHPGFVQTPGNYGIVAQAAFFLRPLLHLIVALTFVTPQVGAYSTEFAATSIRVREAPEEYRGAYITPPNKVPALKGQARSPELGKQLWSFSEKVVEKVLKEGKYSE